MHVDIHGRKVTLKRTVERAIRSRLGESLRRFAGAIAGVRVEVSDRNGRRGGGDKKCRIEVTLLGGGRIVRDEVDANVWTACRHAMDRLEKAVWRQFRAGPVGELAS